MNWFKSKAKKLNETTRLYALYGESRNLKYLEDKVNNVKEYVDNQDNALSRKINANTASIANNVNSIYKLQNRLDNLPVVDTSKFTTKTYVDTQDSLLRGDIAIAQGGVNANKSDIKKNKDNLSELSNRVVDLALEHNKFAKKDTRNTFTEENIFRKNVDIDNDATVGGTLSTNVLSTISTANIGGKLFLRQGGSVYSSNITDSNSIVNKGYVDNAIVNAHSRFNYFYRSYNTRFLKKDVSASRSMFWYEINNGETISFSQSGFSANRNYFYLVLLYQVNSQRLETYVCSGITTADRNGYINVSGQDLGAKTMVSWRDLYPGGNGTFTANAEYKILCIAI